MIMLQYIKQARAAFGLLNPEEVRRRAGRSLHVGLVAASEEGYSEMEEFLVPTWLSRDTRIELMGQVHRAGDEHVPAKVDIVLYEQGLRAPEGTYTFHRDDPETTAKEILDDRDDWALPLARQFPTFRKAVIDGIIQTIARENAMFVIATALPNVMPNVMQVPWALGEFASDTAFLTANQIRMAFLIGAACGCGVGLSEQKGAVILIIGGAFGWRALARELAGKIPLGQGLIPKGAIAYAGTFVVGKAIQKYQNGTTLTRDEREEIYREALDQGRTVAQSFDRRP
jgi:uncharacterized protein (DUF697 family)